MTESARPNVQEGGLVALATLSDKLLTHDERKLVFRAVSRRYVQSGGTVLGAQSSPDVARKVCQLLGVLRLPEACSELEKIERAHGGDEVGVQARSALRSSYASNANAPGTVQCAVPALPERAP